MGRTGKYVARKNSAFLSVSYADRIFTLEVEAEGSSGRGTHYSQTNKRKLHGSEKPMVRYLRRVPAYLTLRKVPYLYLNLRHSQNRENAPLT